MWQVSGDPPSPPSLLIPGLLKNSIPAHKKAFPEVLRAALHNPRRVFQVCFGVAVHISYHLKQGVIFIDTTGGLTARRLLRMLQAETSSTDEQVSAEACSLRTPRDASCEPTMSFSRWKLFRGSRSSACLTSSLCSTVCTVFAPTGSSRSVMSFPVSFNDPAEAFEKTDQVFI